MTKVDTCPQCLWWIDMYVATQFDWQTRWITGRAINVTTVISFSGRVQKITHLYPGQNEVHSATEVNRLLVALWAFSNLHPSWNPFVHKIVTATSFSCYDMWQNVIEGRWVKKLRHIMMGKMALGLGIRNEFIVNCFLKKLLYYWLQ